MMTYQCMLYPVQHLKMSNYEIQNPEDEPEALKTLKIPFNRVVTVIPGNWVPRKKKSAFRFTRHYRKYNNFKGLHFQTLTMRKVLSFAFFNRVKYYDRAIQICVVL